MKFVTGFFRRLIGDPIQSPQGLVAEPAQAKDTELSNELFQGFIGGQLRWSQGDIGFVTIGEILHISYSKEEGLQASLRWAAVPKGEEEDWVFIGQKKVSAFGASTISGEGHHLRLHFHYLSESWEFYAPGNEFLNPAQILKC